MCYSKIPSEEEIKKLRTDMHRGVDMVCDHLESNREDQAKLALTEMEDQVSEDMLDAVKAHCQDQEFAPLVHEELQELYRRVRCKDQRPSDSDLETEGPQAQQAEETLCQKIWRWFQEMLQRLTQIWQKVWAWVKEKMAALCRKVEKVWNMITSFFSSVVQFFQSIF